MACCNTGNRPLPETVLTLLVAAHIPGFKELNRVKGDPMLDDRPGARWPAIRGWHLGTSWNPCPGIETSPIKYVFVTSALSYCTLIELAQKCIHTTCVNLFPHISLSHNSLPRNDARCWYIYWSRMAQMMAWCLRASRLYLNKCWPQTVCCLSKYIIEYVWELPGDNQFMLATTTTADTTY